MNLQAKLIVPLLGLAALPLAQANDYEDTGRVLRVEPRVEQYRAPRQECRTDYVQVPVQAERPVGGSIVGGIAGALLGSQVGSGSGRVAASAAGAIAGAVVGDRVENNGRPQTTVQEQAVRQCRTVDALETRTIGYQVTYEYRGQTHTALMQQDPGSTVRVRVSVQPLEGYAAPAPRY